jgi:serine peptidase DegS
MSKLNNFLGFLLRAITAGLALAFIVVYLWPAVTGRQEATRPPPASQAPTPASYADAVNRTAPAVVSIYTRSMTPGAALLSNARTPARMQVLYRMTMDEGSGVIMSEDGYILTNHHVIDQANSITIGLWDGRRISARVVGSDIETDLAVLKVNLTDLPTAPINEDRPISVGDVVLAIGNALRLSHSVTMGIVSATGRNVSSSQLFEDFIQTDAAINRGNSGGALINTYGELIGINTRVTEQNIGQNIGFAIPVALARNVMNQIVEYGTVRRGWLGAEIGDLWRRTLPDGSVIRRGVRVGEVERGSPAWNAGLREGDIIVSLDGEAVSDASRFLLAISQREPGSQVELDVNRDEESFQTYATLIQQPPLKAE